MRFFVVKSSTLKFIFLMTIVCALLSLNFGGSAFADVFFNKSNRKIPIYCVDTSEKQVAISFDAAWGSDKTEKIIDILNEYDVKATFFLVGFWVDKNPDLVKKIHDNNFEIGTHSNTHPDLAKLSVEKIDEELQQSIEKIYSITKSSVKLFRAPFGSYNNLVIEQAEKLGLKTIQWDVDSLDWQGISMEQITSNILKNIKNGSIILCHNNSDHIVDALPSVLQTLKQRGFKVGTIGSLIYENDYTIDATGKQIKC